MGLPELKRAHIVETTRMGTIAFVGGMAVFAEVRVQARHGGTSSGLCYMKSSETGNRRIKFIF